MKVSSSQQADLYGQVHPTETEEYVSSALTKFNEFQLSGAAKDASIQCPKLLTDTMKLKFLRAEVFHVEVSEQTEKVIVCCSHETIIFSVPSKPSTNIGSDASKFLVRTAPFVR